MNMRMPKQAPPVQRSIAVGRLEIGIRPSDCPWYKAAACGAATVACGALAEDPPALIGCLAAIGQTSCVDCITG